ncbi:hypothetical protein HMPREF1545_00977 [Oscillibacter sp. KLE 1728]|nr:hypothetical protein HMPREF1545_00977 [Oscillibacter sp. KLE 1728]
MQLSFFPCTCILPDSSLKCKQGSSKIFRWILCSLPESGGTYSQPGPST